MKRFFILLTLATFVFTAPLVMAETKTGAADTGAKALTDKTPKINCCVKAKCKQVGSEMECAKEGGKVVKDCKDCK